MRCQLWPKRQDPSHREIPSLRAVRASTRKRTTRTMPGPSTDIARGSARRLASASRVSRDASTHPRLHATHGVSHIGCVSSAVATWRSCPSEDRTGSAGLSPGRLLTANPAATTCHRTKPRRRARTSSSNRRGCRCEDARRQTRRTWQRQSSSTAQRTGCGLAARGSVTGTRLVTAGKAESE